MVGWLGRAVFGWLGRAVNGWPGRAALGWSRCENAVVRWILFIKEAGGWFLLVKEAL